MVVNDACLSGMDLMRNDERACCRDVEQMAKCCSVFLHILRLISTVTVKVQFSVKTLACPSVACGAESRYTLTQVIVCQLRIPHSQFLVFCLLFYVFKILEILDVLIVEVIVNVLCVNKFNVVELTFVLQFSSKC